MRRLVAMGAIVGMTLGFLLSIFFPNLRETELGYLVDFRKSADLPLNPLFSSGSVVGGVVAPLVLGVFGGFVGLAVYKLFVRGDN